MEKAFQVINDMTGSVGYIILMQGEGGNNIYLHRLIDASKLLLLLLLKVSANPAKLNPAVPFQIANRHSWNRRKASTMIFLRQSINYGRAHLKEITVSYTATKSGPTM